LNVVHLQAMIQPGKLIYRAKCLVFRMRAAMLFALIIPFSNSLHAQEVYQHISNTDIYDFMDELANAHVIHVNTAIKPYSRIFIAEQLNEAQSKPELLTARQQKEVAFYMEDYGKELRSERKWNGKRLDLYYYKDSLFTVSLNPILGFSLYANDTIHNMYHRWNGAEVFAYAGKNFGFYASLRDNRENKRLSSPDYLNQFPGAEYKLDGVSEAGDYSEMRGGLTYTWKWGSVGLVKDHFVWGDNYHGSNIFSGRTPSFAHLRLHIQPVQWLDFNYVHGWLISGVNDTVFYNYPGYRLVYRPKYLAANMVTVTPWKNLDVSIGNSIVYSDKDVQPAYLIPFFFYKSVDHSSGGTGSNWLGENSQMYFNISSRHIRNVHLYTSVFVDEISFSNATDPKTQSNFISAKIGARLSNFPVHDVFLTAEYTRTNPVVYRHYISTSTFASNLYNLGHYLGDNSQEIFFSAGYKPFARLTAEISWSIAQRGEEYPYNTIPGTGSGKGDPFIQLVYWQAKELNLHAQYQVIHDCYLFAGLLISDHHGVDVGTYTQPYFRGKKTTINVGANIGF